jgi:hypothetical protein
MRSSYLTFNFLTPEQHQFIKYLWLDREDTWKPDSIHGTLALRFPNDYGVHIHFGYMKHPPTPEHNYSAALIKWTGAENWDVITDHPLVPDMDLFYVTEEEVKEFTQKVMEIE